MIDEGKIAHKLGSLREYVQYLRGYQKHVLEELERNHTLRGAVERYFQLSAECVIDICEILISGLKLQRPEEYRQAIDILGEEGILPNEFAYHLAPIAGFRNISVREYGQIDLMKVCEHLQKDMDDIDMFAKYIPDYLNKRHST